MSRAPTISVIIPAYNEERYIGKCLSALKQQQSPVPFEILVVDNNSTDATVEIAAREGAWVVREEEQGVCAARQRGCFAASGAILVSTDADTVVPQGWLSKIHAVFSSRSDIVAVAGPFRYDRFPRWGLFYSATLFFFVRCVWRALRRVEYAPASNFAFRRSAFEAIGGYNTQFTQGGDERDLVRRLRARGKIAYIHDNCVSTSSRRLRRGFIYTVFVTFLWYYCMGYLTGRATGRALISAYPPFRADENIRHAYRRRILIVAAIVIIFHTMNVHHLFSSRTISWSHEYPPFVHRHI